MSPHLTNSSRGFTLIELMVVMVIIGVMAGFAVLSMGIGKRDEVHHEAKRLAALIEIAIQESLLSGQELGLRFSDHGYEFYTLGVVEDKPKWVPLQDDEHLSQPRELPESIELELYVEGNYVDLQNTLLKGVHVYLLSSGEITPFALEFRHLESELIYQLQGAITGAMKLEKLAGDDG